MLAAIKAAALVEYNAPDYVAYLKRVFRDQPPKPSLGSSNGGAEEKQHGVALGRWAELADQPSSRGKPLPASARVIAAAAFLGSHRWVGAEAHAGAK